VSHPVPSRMYTPPLMHLCPRAFLNKIKFVAWCIYLLCSNLLTRFFFVQIVQAERKAKSTCRRTAWRRWASQVTWLAWLSCKNKYGDVILNFFSLNRTRTRTMVLLQSPRDLVPHHFQRLSRFLCFHSAAVRFISKFYGMRTSTARCIHFIIV
jgi:hypothetical protein